MEKVGVKEVTRLGNSWCHKVLEVVPYCSSALLLCAFQSKSKLGLCFIFGIICSAEESTGCVP